MQPFEASQCDIINQMSKPVSKVSFDRQGNLSDRSFCCPWCFFSVCPSIYLSMAGVATSYSKVGPSSVQIGDQHPPALTGPRGRAGATGQSGAGTREPLC